MLLNLIKVEFREKLLVEKYFELINSGVKPSQILVLVQNSTLKKKFSEKILKEIKIDAIEKLNVHSFFSIVYSIFVIFLKPLFSMSQLSISFFRTARTTNTNSF